MHVCVTGFPYMLPCSCPALALPQSRKLPCTLCTPVVHVRMLLRLGLRTSATDRKHRRVHVRAPHVRSPFPRSIAQARWHASSHRPVMPAHPSVSRLQSVGSGWAIPLVGHAAGGAPSMCCRSGDDRAPCLRRRRAGLDLKRGARPEIQISGRPCRCCVPRSRASAVDSMDCASTRRGSWTRHMGCISSSVTWATPRTYFHAAVPSPAPLQAASAMGHTAPQHAPAVRVRL